MKHAILSPFYNLWITCANSILYAGLSVVIPRPPILNHHRIHVSPAESHMDIIQVFEPDCIHCTR